MSGNKVRALYDFSAEPNTTEISISAGDVLVIIRRDIGEGWLEGRKQNGETGLFPQAYVEELESEPPDMPPPLPPVYAEVPETDWPNMTDWNQQQNENEEWDDEWDDDSETGTTHPVTTVATLNSGARGEPARGPVGPGGPVGKMSFNRFSSFVKSGGESYILGNVKFAGHVKEEDKVIIYYNSRTAEWAPNPEPYSCIIDSPKKESKMRGLKSYIAYQLTPTLSNIQVSRRYKQFDWLHDRLQEKFSIIPIPPLPEKQIAGRYEEDFIEHRKTQLQAFVNCVCRHPVLSRSTVWKHFITCTDSKMWKLGKRHAEKDELVGGKWFLAIQAPEEKLESFLVEKETEDCTKFIQQMDVAVRNLSTVAMDQSKRLMGPYSTDFNKIGTSLKSLAVAFEGPGTPKDPLTKAVTSTGEIYVEISKFMTDQPRYDWQPLGDVLHIYKGIISSFPEILQLHRNALNKRKEISAGLNSVDAEKLQNRTDTLSYALMAEINHFHQERANDFKLAMQGFLREQIAFYQKIVDSLQVAYNAYDY